jgi:hypothetical protein
VGNTGYWGSSPANNTLGVSPAFRIGWLKQKRYLYDIFSFTYYRIQRLMIH